MFRETLVSLNSNTCIYRYVHLNEGQNNIGFFSFNLYTEKQIQDIDLHCFKSITVKVVFSSKRIKFCVFEST